MKKNILIVLGTRPEVIKLAPVVLEMQTKKDVLNVVLCNTSQQKELSAQALSYFGLRAAIDLDVMRQNQTLGGLQAKLIAELNELFIAEKYDGVIVQGDTMTAFCGALAAFYNKVPVFHVEAGLRSYDLAEPFPEEALRQMLTRITSLHFAPTNRAAQALVAEGMPKDRVLVTGNTVIDALNCIIQAEIERAVVELSDNGIRLNDKVILVTVHRRENHGERLSHIIKAIAILARKYTEHQFVLPVHPNPNVRNEVHEKLGNFRNIFLTEPLDYPKLITLMRNSRLILTDSGGIQEEAPSFHVPVLVLRYETERYEGVEAGFSKLVGADIQKITEESFSALDNSIWSNSIQGRPNPYGDGRAGQLIVKAILNW